MSRLSSVEAHKPCCVVVVNHFGARFFRYWLGKMSELGEQNYRVNISQWKRKDLGHVAHPGIKTTRGSQPDAFQDRIDAQYLHLCKEMAKRTASLCRMEDLHTIFLVGSERLTKPIETALPKIFRPRVVLIAKDLGNFSASQLQRRLEPAIAEWTAKQAALKPRLHESSETGGLVLGLKKRDYQEGHARSSVKKRAAQEGGERTPAEGSEARIR